MIKTAIYARVSTDKQATDTQIKDLRDFASALGHEVVAEYKDMMSGGNPARPEFKRLLDDADAHKFDMILIWALDRFSREGILATLSYLNRLRRANIALKSLKESWLDTSDAGIGQLLIAIFSWVAEQERKRISERVKAGIRRKPRKPRGPDKHPRKKSGYYRRWERGK